jgi:hypothetical protein
LEYLKMLKIKREIRVEEFVFEQAGARAAW